jgi:Zn-dependent peptidase ImmA (M78 family)
VFTVEQLEELAEKLRDKLDISSSNFIDMTEFADELELEVYETDFDDKELESTLVEEDDEKCIYVDRQIDEPSKRFSIAKQIAHVILNHTEKLSEKEYLVSYKRQLQGVSNPEDYGERLQAMVLASALIMPKKLVLDMWDKSHSVEVVADYFAVPIKAAMFRLDILGLI